MKIFSGFFRLQADELSRYGSQISARILSSTTVIFLRVAKPKNGAHSLMLISRSYFKNILERSESAFSVKIKYFLR
ncbi:hypothetical protein GS511_14005 [Leptospira borgpetersenii]|uniref:Uncharacterized protein n=2 Tax=Leptospira borgpetersenii TaxID=174 RepID=M3HVR9_LEPBO|nr:hypothetical protein LBBP_03183 [Leptospira borgpetersenii serovar Ballum]EKQ99705.1 hypothetical protein LEP1GSC121_2116 [Leptospira borgpetersenii serovar Castellonis str. 200801910]EMG02136.1 hypothetical protein LEP1GSC123_2684 [Leptospira borgpetersenii str. 200701203]EMK12410.1 hypothetical protein LEP1GSC066_3286 [Leptospira sp. serovar Kenya str. Sh9]EMO09075.1 hypothetical protein LEP1GSC137_2525 [Leptospira borgpetersenii str. Noumea 25]QHE27953.1 hypothetical protein GS524_14005 